MGVASGNEIGLHVPRMYRVALRFLGDADKAQDVVQDACVKAVAGMGRFNAHASLATWLHRITVNCAKDALRSDDRKEKALQQLQSQQAQRVAAGRPTQSPAALAEQRELTELAWTLLEKLPDDCRSAFALTQLDGYSYDAAGEIEGEPRGTIASRVFRAKKILLEQMNAHIDGGRNHDD
jgi:RNA polymerase sigma-70 factor (ECF subfamily)